MFKRGFAAAASSKTRMDTWAADKQRAALAAASLDFAKAMGYGGGTLKMNTLFRRVFASRLVEPEVAAKLGVRHTKGLLLYGLSTRTISIRLQPLAYRNVVH